MQSTQILYRVAYGKRKALEEDCEVVEIKENEIPVTKKFVKGVWECVGTDKMNDNEWDKTFKPFGESEYMTVEKYESLYPGPEDDEEKEVIWWHDYRRSRRKS